MLRGTAVIALGVAWLSAWSGGARAQDSQCASDNDCDKGFRCEVTAVSGCAAPARAPAMDPAIDAGAGDADFAPGVIPECKSQEYRSCVPGPCMVDADCASGMVCHAQNVGTCSSGAAPPCTGGICPPPKPPVCTEQIERSCLPRYLLPCEQASDCGPGFACEAATECSCAGSAGSAGVGTPTPSTPAPEPAPTPDEAAKFVPAPPSEADGGTAGAGGAAGAQPWDGGCTCKPSAVKSCRLLELPCKADTDCPGDLACQVTGVSGGSAGCARPEPGGADGGGGAGATCATIPMPEPVVTRSCVPPYAGVALDGRGVATPTTGTPGSAPSGGPNDPGKQEQGGAVTPNAPPVAGHTGAAGSGDADESPAPRHEKACATTGVGQNHGGGMLAGLGLLTLAAALIRRRRR